MSSVIDFLGIYILKGNLSDEDIDKIKSYIINPVDSRECTLEKPENLEDKQIEPEDVEVVDGFINMTEEDSKRHALRILSAKT